MTRDLNGEIVAFLGRGPATATEIAAGVRARRADVDEALLDGPFAEAPAPEGAHPLARHWSAAPLPSRAVPERQSDKDFLLHVLADGGWHSLSEILTRSFRERGCGLTVHSRASDLRRKDGLDIEQRATTSNDRRGSEYRLLRETVGGGSVVPSPSPVSLSEPPASPRAESLGVDDGTGGSLPPGQLSLSIPRSGYEQAA